MVMAAAHLGVSILFIVSVNFLERDRISPLHGPKLGASLWDDYTDIFYVGREICGNSPPQPEVDVSTTSANYYTLTYLWARCKEFLYFLPSISYHKRPIEVTIQNVPHLSEFRLSKFI